MAGVLRNIGPAQDNGGAFLQQILNLKLLLQIIKKIVLINEREKQLVLLASHNKSSGIKKAENCGRMP